MPILYKNYYSKQNNMVYLVLAKRTSWVEGSLTIGSDGIILYNQ